MAYTDEPRGLKVINNLNTNAFGSIISQACWFFGSTLLTLWACYMMSRDDYYIPVGAYLEGVKGVGPYRQMILVSLQQTRDMGVHLADALLLAWTGKTVAGVVDSQGKRKTHPDYAPVLEAEAKGKAAGAAAIAVIAEQAKDAAAARAMTMEHVIPGGVADTVRKQRKTTSQETITEEQVDTP